MTTPTGTTPRYPVTPAADGRSWYVRDGARTYEVREVSFVPVQSGTAPNATTVELDGEWFEVRRLPPERVVRAVAEQPAGKRHLWLVGKRGRHG